MNANANAINRAGMRSKWNFKVFTLYLDFPASARAKRLVQIIAGAVGTEFSTRSEMWKLDSLSPVGPFRSMIGQEAGESDVLIVASSRPVEPERAFIDWLDSMVNWKAHRLSPGLLLGLIGSEDHTTSANDWMIHQLAAFARETRMRWRWHQGDRDAWDHPEWLLPPLHEVLQAKRLTPPGWLEMAGC